MRSRETKEALKTYTVSNDTYIVTTRLNEGEWCPHNSSMDQLDKILSVASLRQRRVLNWNLWIPLRRLSEGGFMLLGYIKTENSDHRYRSSSCFVHGQESISYN